MFTVRSYNLGTIAVGKTFSKKISAVNVLARYKLQRETSHFGMACHTYLVARNHVYRDAYEIAHGAILSHVSNGKETPVTYTFNTFSATQRKYSAG